MVLCIPQSTTGVIVKFVLPPQPATSVAIAGSTDLFPVRRIYCVGRNYAAHAREMGTDPSREAPFFFTKPADAVVASGQAVPYPPRTQNFHHEIELVVAIGQRAKNVAVGDANRHIWGYAVGNDLTRRDLQLQARDKGRPWDTGKAFDHSAVISPLHSASKIGHIKNGRIWLNVNSTKRQESDIDLLIWSVPEIVAELSTLFTLEPGDLIFTGTPEGVGPLQSGDLVEGGIDGLDVISHRIAAAQP
jgi:fumarylpyruvate hydrolase